MAPVGVWMDPRSSSLPSLDYSELFQSAAAGLQMMVLMDATTTTTTLYARVSSAQNLRSGDSRECELDFQNASSNEVAYESVKVIFGISLEFQDAASCSADECSESIRSSEGRRNCEAATTSSIRLDEIEMRRVFEKFDENRDGSISAEDLKRVMKQLGFRMSEEEVRSMLEAVDPSGDGSRIHLDAFRSLFCEDGVGVEVEDALLEAFGVFDKNGDGFISAGELQAVLRDLEMADGRTLRDCERMILGVDGDGNGKLDIHEFRLMLSSKSLQLVS